MAYLDYGLSLGEGFIVITGEVCAGKTTLVRNLFRQLEAHNLIAAQLVSTQLDATVPWTLSRMRMSCEQCGSDELHDESERLIIEVLECIGCGKHVCKRCYFLHQKRGHA